MYDLYIDDPQAIKCKAEISGAENANKKVRLMVETSAQCLYFNGSVSDTGEINVPMHSLKNILKESTGGKLMLEMVIDDTLFTPWETDFVTKLKKKVAISEVKSTNSQKGIKMLTTPTPVEEKTTNVPETPKNSVKERSSIIEHTKSIVSLLRNSKITYSNIVENKDKVSKVISEYIVKNKLNAEQVIKIQDILMRNITEI